MRLVTFAAIQAGGATPPFFWRIVPVAARKLYHAKGARMSPDIPAWQPIDTTDGILPGPLDVALDAADSVAGCVVFLVTPEIDRKWGANASLLLARGWAAKGRSVLLADASFEDPILHQVVDGVGEEGLSDIMLYGASVKRVARPVEGGILVVPAGTPVGNAEEVLAHPKWDTVVRGFEEAGAVLLLHLSAATTGAGALLDRAARIVVASSAAGDAESLLGSASNRVLAVVGPEVAEESAAVPEVPPMVDPEVEPTPEPESEWAHTAEPEPELAGMTEAEPESDAEVEMVSDMNDPQEPELEAEPDAVPAGVAEEDTSEGGLFSMGELPESTGSAADQVADSGAFSFDDMSGSQYDTHGDAGAEPPISSAEAGVESEPALEAESLEVESLEVDSLEVESLQVESPATDEAPAAAEAPSGADEGTPEEEGMIEGVTRSAVEMDEAAVAAAAGEAQLDMVGFETGAGFDLEDAPEDGDGGGGEASLGGASDAEEDDSDDAFGFGAGGLEVEASPFAEDEEIEDDEAGDEAAASGLGGVAGDVAFGDRGGSDGEPVPDFGADTPSVVGGDAIAVDAADEAMGIGAGVAPSDDTAPEIAVEFDDGPPAKMSGLEELERRRKRGARVRQLLVAAATAIIVGGGGVGVAYLGFVNIPGITPADRVRSAVPGPIELPGPTPMTPVISHVLVVDTWRNMETALSTVEALRERLPEFLFFVSIAEMGGGDQYALLVGPAFSAVEADALKEPLSEVLDRLDPATWTVQEARYSFFFGEYANAADAAGRVQALSALSIPAHVLEVAYPDETTAMRVYGGAFVDEFQAAAMGRLLRANDLDDVRLIERRGRLPK